MKSHHKITIPIPTTEEEQEVFDLFCKTFHLVQTGSEHRGKKGEAKILYFDQREKKPETGWSYRSPNKTPEKAKPKPKKDKLTAEEARNLFK